MGKVCRTKVKITIEKFKQSIKKMYRKNPIKDPVFKATKFDLETMKIENVGT